MRLLFTGLFSVLLCLGTLPTLAGEPPAETVKAKYLFGIGLGYGSWSGGGDFVPEGPSTIALESGPFGTDAIGIELTFHGRAKSTGRLAWFFGADLGAYMFENERSVDLEDGWSGDDWDTWDEGRLMFTVTFLTASTRVVFAASSSTQWHLLAGAGFYFGAVGFQSDTWGGCYCGWYSCCGGGYEDTGNEDWSPGGYLGLGVEFPLGAAGGLRLDGRAHFFKFRNLGNLFPGQSANGPLFTFALAWDFGLK